MRRRLVLSPIYQFWAVVPKQVDMFLMSFFICTHFMSLHISLFELVSYLFVAFLLYRRPFHVVISVAIGTTCAVPLCIALIVLF